MGSYALKWKTENGLQNFTGLSSCILPAFNSPAFKRFFGGLFSLGE